MNGLSPPCRGIDLHATVIVTSVFLYMMNILMASQAID